MRGRASLTHLSVRQIFPTSKFAIATIPALKRWSDTVPRYYFHLYNDTDVQDREGKEFTDLQAARLHATDLAKFEFAEAAKERARVKLSHRIEIESPSGVVVATVTFGDAVKV